MDIYFQETYGTIYEKNGDGIREVFEYEDENGLIRNMFLKRRIPNQNELLWDITTPYGYGGPVIEWTNNQAQLVKLYDAAFTKYCRENGIVSEFVRFHPMQRNALDFNDIMEVSFNRQTICLDTSSPEVVWDNLSSSCRRNVKIAKKKGIIIEKDTTGCTIEHFIDLYEDTMNRKDALDYYYFNQQYFTNIINLLKGQFVIFNAVLDEQIIGSSMVLFGDQYAHLHLSGSSREYQKYYVNNLLHYEAALWANEQGLIGFHLGGGYQDGDDSLFNFKKSFNQNSDCAFYIGKKIHMKDIYEQLSQCKTANGNNFFPLYRL